MTTFAAVNRILITGASGFIGSFIAEEALRRGMEVWAAVRKTSSRRYLADRRLHFVELCLDDEEQMAGALAGVRPDYVVHAAGATKCTDANDFRRINTLGTINLVNALHKACPDMKRLVYISSLSVFGPCREAVPHTPISETDTPRPDTAYGRSKLEAEAFLAGQDWLDYIVLRPTGVYGPREKDYFLMVKSIAAHTDFAAGYRRQDLTFVYVKDVVQAVLLATEKGARGRAYFLSDGQVYSSRAFSDLIHEQLDKPWLIRIKAPLWLLRAITFAGEYVGRCTGKPTALNNDKYHIMRQRNWMCDIEPARRELGYEPHYPLAEGVRLAMEWYKAEKWI